MDRRTDPPTAPCYGVHAPLLFSPEREVFGGADDGGSSGERVRRDRGARASGAGHSHGHGGDHRPRQRRALLVCIALTGSMLVVEVMGGLWTGSLMLLSDAVHMLSHALALGVSYLALWLASRPPRARWHFGFYRAEILGALLNGVGVLLFSLWIAVEAFQRFRNPQAVLGGEMTAIAALGLAANLATAVILARAGAEDLNTKSAFLHMLGDTLSSVVIVIGGGVLWATGAWWIDPALSVLVAAVVLYWSFNLLRQSLAILMEASPAHIDPEQIRRHLVESAEEVLDAHDLHVWEITSGYVCLTAHLVVADAPLSDLEPMRARLAHELRERFHVGHATLQIETTAAGLAPRR